MKVNVGNIDYFNDKNKFSLKRLACRGIIIASTLFALGSSTVGCKHNSELDMMVTSTNADISVDEINSMNIIINDNDCSDTLFGDVCKKLNEDGLEFKTTKNNIGVNEDNSVVITLDQQYSSGSDTIIFAPYDNSRVGYSDSLALSMQSAFEQNGFLGNNIVCGKVGYREDENGNVISSIPTETEEALESDSDVSFVTISFGTQELNSNWVAKSIENGLARQKYYLNNYDAGTDLIYRASSTDDLDVIADYFNTDVNTLNNFNKVEGQELYDSQAIINPNVEKMSVFNRNSNFSIDEAKTRAY